MWISLFLAGFQLVDFCLFTEGKWFKWFKVTICWGLNDFLMDRILLQPGISPQLHWTWCWEERLIPIQEKVHRAKLQTHRQLKVEYLNIHYQPPFKQSYSFFFFSFFFCEKTMFSCYQSLLNQWLCITLIILCSLHVITTLEWELSLSHHKTKIEQQVVNSKVQTPVRQII